MRHIKNKKIIFISHSANPGGAPMLLLQLISHLKTAYHVHPYIIVGEHGALMQEFEVLGPTYVWPSSKKINAPISVLGKISAGVTIVRTLLQLRKASLIFSNTIANGAIEKKLSFLKLPVYCYVHELEMAIRDITNPLYLEWTINNSAGILAVSKAVKQNLLTRHRVPAAKVSVVPTLVSNITGSDDKLYGSSTFRIKNEIPAGAVVVGIVANNEPRKGFHLFYPLVHIYKRMFSHDQVHFVWVGIKKSTLEDDLQKENLKKQRLSGMVHLLPFVKERSSFFHALDIHLSLSLEDPYPLVVLEAAQFGIPTVCFEKSGGAPEFVEEDCGCIVPYGDLMEMAVRIHSLVEREELRRTLGAQAKLKVQERHHVSTALHAVAAAIGLEATGIYETVTVSGQRSQASQRLNNKKTVI